jgi:hypothetical protein
MYLQMFKYIKGSTWAYIIAATLGCILVGSATAQVVPGPGWLKVLAGIIGYLLSGWLWSYCVRNWVIRVSIDAVQRYLDENPEDIALYLWAFENAH